MPGEPQETSLLRFEDVSVRYGADSSESRPALDGFRAELFPGEVLALVGESGSGKSTAGFAAAGLLPQNARVSGKIHFGSAAIDAGDPNAFRRFRGRRIGFVFQEPSTALHPAIRVEQQISEALHPAPPRAERKERVLQLLRSVRLEPTRSVLRAFPHQLSGGMQQRVILAMAFANQPDVIVADEPTTALDPTIRKEILELLRAHATDHGKTVLLITHDFGIVAHFADRVAVLYQGKIVETGCKDALLESPGHPYTRSLLDSARTTAGVARMLPGDRGGRDRLVSEAFGIDPAAAGSSPTPGGRNKPVTD